MADVPREVIERMLLRLPAKSLITFKCVSKQWLSLISSRRFIKLHLEQTRLEGSDKHIVQSLVRPFSFYCIDHESPISINDDSTGAVTSLYIPQLNGKLWVHHIIGSCDGLLCMVLTGGNGVSLADWNPRTREFETKRRSSKKNDIVFVVSNPCTREYLEIPCPVDYYGYILPFCGFGYASSENDYKLISGMYNDGMKVLSMKSSSKYSWRSVKYHGNMVASNQRAGAVVNGAVHWTMRKHTTRIYVIFAFDLEHEKISELPMPDCAKDQFHKSIVFDGYLSVTRRRIDNLLNICEVWSMKLKEYGIAESWMKVLSVSITDIPYVSPWCYAKNGEIVMWAQGEVVIRCNLKECVYTRLLGDFRVCDNLMNHGLHIKNPYCRQNLCN